MEDRPDLHVDPLHPEILSTVSAAATATGPQIGNGSQQRDTDNKMHAEVLAQAQASTATALLAGATVSGSSSGRISTNGSSTTATSTAAVAEKAAGNFITRDVIDGIFQCLISQADECQRNGLPAHQTEKIIVEKMGRCMEDILDFAIRSMDASFTPE